MSHQPDTFTPTVAQIELVQRGYRAGKSRAEIATALGISVDSFDRHRAAGDFGAVPKRRGIGGGRPRHEPDDETIGRLFGSTDWPARQDEVRRSWTPEEAYDRRRGKLPNDAQPDVGPRLGRAGLHPVATTGRPSNYW